MGRASGIPASRCPDGPSPAIGGPTASRFGTTRAGWPRPTATTDSASNAARQFAEELARRLEVGPQFVINAYEDPLAYLLKERKLPANVDPLDNKLDDPLEREKLRQVFERGLGQPVGYVLPLKRAEAEDGPEWQSCLWTLRSEHLYLIPGDSPVGLRLPLETLIWEPAGGKAKGPRRLIPPPPRDRCPFLSGGFRWHNPPWSL